MRHACAVCPVLIDRDYLMCPAHWKMVDPALRRIVIRTYNKGMPLQGYRSARDAAISYVLAKL